MDKLPKGADLQRWPMLYKKEKAGKLRVWEIWVRGAVIHSRTGQEGSVNFRETSDTIRSGKNIGRSNETTPHEQAVSEAQSKYDKQLDRGYVPSRDAAIKGELSAKILGGFFPMLAEKYQESRSHVRFPCYVQPKLDGLRATFGDGFFSRTRKPFKALKHLEREVVRLGLDHLPLDGEAYNHELRDDFQSIVGAVKRDKTDHPLLPKIQYHIYDLAIAGMDYAMRKSELTLLSKKMRPSDLVKFVETRLVRDEAELMAAYEEFVDAGYEGLIIRNSNGEYENRRTVNLQKLKMMEDSEFRIVGIKEGRGSLQDHVGKFVCVVEDPLGGGPDKFFDVILKGTGRTAFLKKAFTDKKLWEGKWMQVQYFGWTKKNGKQNVPRHPVGMQIREAE